MLTRILTASVLIAIAIAGIGLGGWYFIAAYMIILGLCFYEMSNALRQKKTGTVIWPSWVAFAFALPILGHTKSIAYIVTLVAAASMLTGACVIFRKEPKADELVFSVLPLFCILLPGMCMIGFSGHPNRYVQVMMELLALGIPLMGDTMAYFIGSAWGKHRLCPEVSPKKSVEGAVAGLFGSIAFAVVIWFIYRPLITLPPMWHFIVLGLIGGAAGQLGDLYASLIKRYCGVKDYSTLLPGHGGMMDRMDSTFFAAVVLYAYLNLQFLPIG